MDWNLTSNRHRSANEGVSQRGFFACIITVMHNDADMETQVSQPEPVNGSAPRITVTLPLQHYREIVQRAKSKRVSASWIVRDAVEQYLAADIPLFANNERRSS